MTDNPTIDTIIKVGVKAVQLQPPNPQAPRTAFTNAAAVVNATIPFIEIRLINSMLEDVRAANVYGNHDRFEQYLELRLNQIGALMTSATDASAKHSPVADN